MKNSAIEDEDIIDQINNWPFAFVISMVFLLVFLVQSMWNVVSGLYFSYAYEAVVWPYIIYQIYSLQCLSNGAQINTLKQLLLASAFALLFMPTIYLLMTEQIDLHTAIFGEFDASLEHMENARVLPFVFLAVLFAPIKNYLK